MFGRTEKYFGFKGKIFQIGIRKISYIFSGLDRIGRETELEKNVVDLIELGGDEELQHYLEQRQKKQDTSKQDQVILSEK